MLTPLALRAIRGLARCTAAPEPRHDAPTDAVGTLRQVFSYDPNGNYVATDEATVASVPPGETRTGKGYADLHGTEATATVQLQEFLFEEGEDGKQAPIGQKNIDDRLAFRKIDHFCRVDQAFKDKVAITAKSLKQRWPQDQDCPDGYELHACVQEVLNDIGRKMQAFFDRCKQQGATNDLCQQSWAASQSPKPAPIERCDHLTYHH
jgi:hypothetical protein